MAVEHRDHRELKVSPEGEDDGTLPRTFRLEEFTARQRRNGRSQMWLDETPRKRAVLTGSISRAEAVDLTSQLAEALDDDGSG